VGGIGVHTCEFTESRTGQFCLLNIVVWPLLSLVADHMWFFLCFTLYRTKNALVLIEDQAAELF
jgi:hypothetical protein